VPIRARALRSIRRARLAAAATTALVLCSVAGARPGFPGAEGFAANATGGRGGDVYHVTTLADDPNHVIPGSLFYGLYEKHVPGSGTVPGVGRTIVFDVGGTIYLGNNTLDLKNIKNVTIAGQTAPSPITIVGNTVQITSSSGKETSNIILQHVAIRKGLDNSGDALSIKGSGNTHTIMVDHVSGSWSEDEVISVGGSTNRANNVTVQYSTMSEALTSGHQYGALIRNNQDARISYNRNLFSNNASRNPRPGSYLGTVLDFEFQNNVVYNWSDRAGYTGGASQSQPENVNMNFSGNYMIAGPSTVGGPTTAGGTPVTGARRNTLFTKDASNAPVNLQVYQEGNMIDWSAGASRDGQDIGWTGFANWNGTTSSAFPMTDRSGAPFNYPTAGSVDPADVAYAKIVGGVGAWPWARTATDQRLISELQNYGGVAAQSTPNATEWNALVNQPMTTRPAGWDTDQDGMPNWWETLRGFNPAAADNNTLTTDGYTRLEKYLHFLSAQANWGVDADGVWSQYMNWRGMRPDNTDSSAGFGAVTTAPRTITVDIPVSIAAMSFGGAHAYTLTGPGPITLDVFAGTTTLEATSGSHTIAAPLVLADNAEVTVAGGSNLAITGELTAAGKTITKKGDGLLAVSNVRADALNIVAGQVRVIASGTPAASAGTSVMKSLSIPAGSQLDLTNNALVIDYTTLGSLLSDTRARVSDGRLTSSVADADHGIGYADNATLGLTEFAGQAVDSTSLLVRYTRLGDANVDGVVNIGDFSLLAASFNQPGSWQAGDFNHDGSVNIADFSLLASNFNQSALGRPAGLHAGGSAVPEPAFSLLLFPITMLLRRMR